MVGGVRSKNPDQHFLSFCSQDPEEMEAAKRRQYRIEVYFNLQYRLWVVLSSSQADKQEKFGAMMSSTILRSCEHCQGRKLSAD